MNESWHILIRHVTYGWVTSHMPYHDASCAGDSVLRCGVLQCIAVCCSVLQCIAVCCSVLPCVAVCCRALQCVAGCCRVLPCFTMCCSVLQRVAVCCSVLQYVAVTHEQVIGMHKSFQIWIRYVHVLERVTSHMSHLWMSHVLERVTSLMNHV